MKKENLDIVVALISEDDLIERVEWINHPSISENMYFELPATYSKTYQWFKQLSSRENRIDFVAKLGECSAAMFGFTEIDKINRKAELYILVNPDLQGKGIGYKATTWLINYGFFVLDLNKIYLYTDIQNSAAVNLYSKVGFTSDGILRSDKIRNGRFNDRLIMSILKSEWDKMSWKSNQVDIK